MSLSDFVRRLEEVKRRARGQWQGILPAFGIDPIFLRRHHGSCPVCGGTKRYRYIDKNGDGTWYCNDHRNGSGDGLQLIMDYKGWPLSQAVSEVERWLGVITPPSNIYPGQETHKILKQEEHGGLSESHRKMLRRAWIGSSPAKASGQVYRYLSNRGVLVNPLPAVIREHPGMIYSEYVGIGEDQRRVVLGKYSTMLALVQDPDGKPLSIHRTYLKDGEKARILSPDGMVLSSKKVMSAVKGGGIRLFQPKNGELAIAEGIETSLAVHLMEGIPVWAGISSTIMKGMVLPPEIHRVHVFADNDPPDEKGRRAGIDDARELCDRLVRQGRKVTLEIAPEVGTDFLDYYLQTRRNAA